MTQSTQGEWVTERLAAAYTKALIHNPKAPVFENMQRAFGELPVVAAAPKLLVASELAIEYFEHRLRRYKTRVPVWVNDMKAAIQEAKGQ